jgi:hypothetical protein
VLGGFMAYVLIFLMPFFSFMKSSGRLTEKSFLRTELLFSGYVWFIFFMSYLPRVLGHLPNAGGSYWEHVVLFAAVLTIGGFRIFAYLKSKSALNI